jgi:hypothetical protein
MQAGVPDRRSDVCHLTFKLAGSIHGVLLVLVAVLILLIVI